MPVQIIAATPEADVYGPPEILCAFATDGWSPAGHSLRRLAPGLYAATFDLPRDEWVSYKFLREPDWSTAECGPFGETLGNRRLHVADEGDRLIAFHEIPRWSDRPPPRYIRAVMVGRDAPEATPQRSGDLRVLSPPHHVVTRLEVYLPPNYTYELSRWFPVVYLLSSFDAFQTHQRGGLALDAAIDALNAERSAETPFIAAAAKLTPEPASADVADALLTAVKPAVDAALRTRLHAGGTHVVGCDVGGQGAFAAWRGNPDTFAGCGVVGASLAAADVGPATAPAADTRSARRICVEIGGDDEPTPPADGDRLPPHVVRTRHTLGQLERQAELTAGAWRLSVSDGRIAGDAARIAARIPSVLRFLAHTAV